MTKIANLNIKTIVHKFIISLILMFSFIVAGSNSEVLAANEPGQYLQGDFCQAELPVFNWQCTGEHCIGCLEYRFCYNRWGNALIGGDEVKAICRTTEADWKVVADIASEFGTGPYGDNPEELGCDLLGLTSSNNTSSSVPIYWTAPNSVQPRAPENKQHPGIRAACNVESSVLTEYSEYRGCMGLCGTVNESKQFSYNGNTYVQYTNVYNFYSSERRSGECAPDKYCYSADPALSCDASNGECCESIFGGRIVTQNSPLTADERNSNMTFVSNNGQAILLKDDDSSVSSRDSNGYCLYEDINAGPASSTCVGAFIPKSAPIVVDTNGDTYVYGTPTQPAHTLPRGVYKVNPNIADIGDNYCIELTEYDSSRFCEDVLHGVTLTSGVQADAYESFATHPYYDDYADFANSGVFDSLTNGVCRLPTQCEAEGANTVCVANSILAGFNSNDYVQIPDLGGCGSTQTCVAKATIGTCENYSTFAECRPTQEGGEEIPFLSCGNTGNTCYKKTSVACSEYKGENSSGGGNENTTYQCMTAQEGIGYLSAPAKDPSLGIPITCEGEGEFCAAVGDGSNKYNQCNTARKELFDYCYSISSNDSARQQMCDNTGMSTLAECNEFEFLGDSIYTYVEQGISRTNLLYENYFKHCTNHSAGEAAYRAYAQQGCSDPNLGNDGSDLIEDDLLRCCSEPPYSLTAADSNNNRQTYIRNCMSAIENEINLTANTCAPGSGYYTCLENNYNVACAQYYGNYQEDQANKPPSEFGTINDPLTDAMLDDFDPLQDSSTLAGADLGEIISYAVNFFVFPIAGIILFVMIIWGGFDILLGSTSGQQNRIDQGKKRVTAAIIGFFILFAAYWIVQALELVLGIGATGE